MIDLEQIAIQQHMNEKSIYHFAIHQSLTFFVEKMMLKSSGPPPSGPLCTKARTDKFKNGKGRESLCILYI